jgi:hypothetical protein
MANPTMPAATGEAEQIVEIGAHENAVDSGSGPAAEQYDAAQVHHGDAFVDSDKEGRLSEDEGDGKV